MTQVLDTPSNAMARQNGNGGAVMRIDPRTPASDTNTLKSLMERQADKLRMVLPKHLTPDRLMRVVLVAVSKSELLQKCSINSILQCVMTSAQLGLDCSGVLGSAYMVPFFNNKVGCYEAQLIPGFRGLIDLARRSGEIEDITAHCVYAQDDFDLELGAEPKLKHRPNLQADRRDDDIVGAYMVAYLKGNSRPHVEFVPRGDIDKVRRSSKAGQRGPWADWFPEMCRKTAVKRGIKYLPMSVELADAIALDNDALGNETEVVSAKTSRGAAGVLDKITRRPVSEGQTFEPEPEAVAQAEAEQSAAAAETTLEDVAPDPDTAGAEAEPPSEPVPSPQEQFWIHVREAAEAAGLTDEKFVRNGVKKWALKLGIVGREHEAKSEDVTSLLSAIGSRSGHFAG